MSDKQLKFIKQEVRPYGKPNRWASLLLQNHIHYKSRRDKKGTLHLTARTTRGREQVTRWLRKHYPSHFTHKHRVCKGCDLRIKYCTCRKRHGWTLR